MALSDGIPVRSLLQLLIPLNLRFDLRKRGSPKLLAADVDAKTGSQISSGSFAGAGKQRLVILNKRGTFLLINGIQALGKQIPKSIGIVIKR